MILMLNILQLFFTAVCTDFVKQYKDHAKYGYENFQVAMFYGMNDYVHKPGYKLDIVQALFMDMGVDTHKRLFPAMYHAICDACQGEIVHFLSDDKRAAETSIKQLISEDDAQLLRMHGWVLYELVKKSKFTHIVKKLRMEDKSKLPQYLKFLDVGTNTGLTFPKRTLMPFMRASDTFIRECTTEEKFQIYGRNIIKVTKTMAHNNVGLQDSFVSAAQMCSPDFQTEIALQVFEEWIEKYLNMKLKGRFSDAMERLDNNKSKKLTSKTQNLRDKLLSNHTNE